MPPPTDRAQRFFSLVASLVRQITAHPMPDNTASLCLLCDTVFWRHGEPPAAIVIFHAHRDAPTTAATNTICTRCFAAHQPITRLKAAVLAKLRSTLITDLGELPPPCQAGALAAR
jgi:hypothetical protein